MESVKKVEEWLEIQKPENMCAQADLEAFKKSTEFVKTHVLKNGEKESVTFSERINKKTGFLELCIDNELMSIKAFLFRTIYAAVTAKSSITIKELTPVDPLRERCLLNQKDRGEEVSEVVSSMGNFWKDIGKEVETADFIILSGASEDDFEPAIKRFED